METSTQLLAESGDEGLKVITCLKHTAFSDSQGDIVKNSGPTFN